MPSYQIGFIGAGQMAEAIARGLIETKLYPTAKLIAFDVSEDRKKAFRNLGIVIAGGNAELAKLSSTIIFAVKPQNLGDLLPQLGPSLSKDKLLISICAGVPTATFEKAAPQPLRVIRVMPNLPVKVKQGASAICSGKHATKKDTELALKIFGAVGSAVVVDEKLMDAVTALSGSGPAYVYFLVECMIEAGIREGLAPATARELAIQTIVGAGAMMQADPVPAEEHRRRVTSKGGTTEAAFKKIQETGVRDSLIAAIRAAAERGRELGRG